MSFLGPALFGGLALLTWRQRMSPKTPTKQTYEIEKKHVTLLNEMVKKYELASVNKAARIAVQYAISEPSVQDQIFQQKRCNTCGGKKNKEKVVFELYGKMHAYLQTMQTTYKLKSTDKAMRCLLEFCETDGDREVIFSPKNSRCKNC